ncbi:MAG: hypothetical protein EOM34_00910, partial [Clostridia bacterium]|nr:hypothetical protein [Clostridia bacterium]
MKRKSRKGQSLLAMALVVFLVIGVIPTSAMAEGEHTHDSSCGYKEASPCTHGENHDESCGYKEEQAEVPCDHEHDDACGYATESGCTHSCTDGACSYQPAVEGMPCMHANGEHDETCGYEKGSACSYRESEDDVQNVLNSDTRCNCQTPCEAGEMSTTCPVCSKTDAEYTDCGAKTILRSSVYYTNGLDDLVEGIKYEEGASISVPGEGNDTPSATVAVDSYPETVTIQEGNANKIPAGTYQLKGITQSLSANNNVFVNPPAMTDITIPSYPLSGTQEQKEAWETNYGKHGEGFIYAVYAPAEQKYTLTVTGGTIGTTGILTTGEYKEGETVAITANQPEINKRFTKWSMAADSKGTITDSTQSTTTFSMGKGNAAIQADFGLIEVSGTDGNTNLTFTPNEGTELPAGSQLVVSDYTASKEDVLQATGAYIGKHVLEKEIVSFAKENLVTNVEEAPFAESEYWSGTIIEYSGNRYLISHLGATNLNTGDLYGEDWSDRESSQLSVSHEWYNKKVKIGGIIYHCGYMLEKQVFIYTDTGEAAGLFWTDGQECWAYLNGKKEPEVVSQNNNYVVVGGTTFKTEVLYSADISLVNNGIAVQKPTGTMSIAINSDLTALSPTYVFGAHFDPNGTINTAICKDNTAQIPVTSTSPFMVIALVEDNF